jgi:hypothetical protein
MQKEANPIQEGTKISDLMNLDTDWLKFWYSENSQWKIEKIQESLGQSLMQTVLDFSGDYKDYRDIRLMPEEVEYVVLDMESLDDTYKIDGYDRNNVLNYFRRVGYS